LSPSSQRMNTLTLRSITNVFYSTKASWKCRYRNGFVRSGWWIGSRVGWARVWAYQHCRITCPDPLVGAALIGRSAGQ
jgi:hypothetical protein